MISPFLLSVKLALVTSCLLSIIGLPVACWLAFTRFRLRFLIESVIALPIVLPPTVLGFYLLLAFGSLGAFGVVLMLGGNIAGRTRTASIAIYDDVQMLDYASAARQSLLLLSISFALLVAINGLNRQRNSTQQAKNRLAGDPGLGG